jgi:hypothetical protein
MLSWRLVHIVHKSSGRTAARLPPNQRITNTNRKKEQWHLHHQQQRRSVLSEEDYTTMSSSIVNVCEPKMRSWMNDCVVMLLLLHMPVPQAAASTTTTTFDPPPHNLRQPNTPRQMMNVCQTKLSKYEPIQTHLSIINDYRNLTQQQQQTQEGLDPNS